jgi:serum/glucocorticoid-regulated kinase 2
MPSAEILPIRFGTIVPTCESSSSPALADASRPTGSDVSRTSNLSLSAYLRTTQYMPGQDNMGNDLLIGRLDLTPVLDAHVRHFFISVHMSIVMTQPQHMSDQWYTAISGSGSFHLTIAYKPARHETLTIDAFDLLKVIGKGSFGKVMQVRKKDTQRIYALKTIRKANIASRPGEITHILAERTVLALVNNPFIVPLKFSFQNPDKLYLVMSFGMSSQTIKSFT